MVGNAARKMVLGMVAVMVIPPPLGLAAHTPAGPWDASLSALASGNTTVFRSAVEPLAVATLLSYTSTHGSYFNASTVNSTIPGWERDAVAADPIGGGMHAIAFSAPPRGIVAFRGTDLDTAHPSGRADGCADALLFGGKLPSQLPAECAAFPAETLAYFDRAVEFATAARARHPGVQQWAFTGHSLGAGLSVLVAAALSASNTTSTDTADSTITFDPIAAVFSSPAVADLVVKLIGNTPAGLGLHHRVVYLASAYDPVFYEADRLHGLPGRVCTWSSAVGPPSACRACFRGQPAYLHRNTVACGECFKAEHVYANYMYKLVPGPRPVCSAATVGPLFPRPTLRAARGSTPRIDGVLEPGEWGDAFSVLAVASPAVQQFFSITNAVDWHLEQCWLKFDATHLYIGVDIDDDVAYGTDTPSWQPAGNPDAHLLNRTGWPWYGDEMEVLVNTLVDVPCVDHKCGVAGNGSQWQMVANTIKSRLGGYGVGGLMEGEPRSDNGTAWETYTRWIETGVLKGATAPRPRTAGARRGYAIEWAVSFAALVLPDGKPFDPATATQDVPIGINLAFGDVDTPQVGDPKFGFRHETWIAGQKNNRTATDEFSTLWLLV